MQRRYNLTHFILTVVVILGLMLLMTTIDAQAQIVFSSNRDGDREIYVMDADGKNQRRLTDSRFPKWDPSWSPDGERIAFTYSKEQDIAAGHWRIYVMDADGKNQRRLTINDIAGWHPSWSPDGKRIAFTYSKEPDFVLVDSDIYVIDADGKNQRKLNKSRSRNTDPSWSPDGKRLTFVSDRDGNLEIYMMNADGPRQVRRLTKDGSEDTDPTWFDPAFAVEVAPFAVAPADKKFTMWGWLKQVDR